MPWISRHCTNASQKTSLSPGSLHASTQSLAGPQKQPAAPQNPGSKQQLIKLLAAEAPVPQRRTIKSQRSCWSSTLRLAAAEQNMPTQLLVTYSYKAYQKVHSPSLQTPICCWSELPLSVHSIGSAFRIAWLLRMLLGWPDPKLYQNPHTTCKADRTDPTTAADTDAAAGSSSIPRHGNTHGHSCQPYCRSRQSRQHGPYSQVLRCVYQARAPAPCQACRPARLPSAAAAAPAPSAWPKGCVAAQAVLLGTPR
jgi:hypothetical protein